MVHRIPDKAFEKGPFSNWELTIKEKPFSLMELYKRIHRFLQEERWFDLKGSEIDNGSGEYEDYFFQRKDGPMQFNQIWWRATKRPEIHGNKYIQFYLALDIATIAMKVKEVVVDGQKMKLEDGELRVRAFLYFVDEDPNKGSTGNEWKQNSILSMAKNLGFWKRENLEVEKRCKMELIKFSNDLYELIQKYTGLKPEGPAKDFFPQGGATN